MLSDIKIRTFTGSSIKPYLASIARLRSEILQEYPYLYVPDKEQELSLLTPYPQCKEAIAVLVFDKATVVGASTAIPLSASRKELIDLFAKAPFDPATVFHFGKSVLLKSYRSRGIGHHFFDLRENHAKSVKKILYTGFWAVSRPENDPKRPKDYLSLENFWKQRGYIPHPEFQYSKVWRDHDEEAPSAKTMLFWMKELLPP